MLFNPRKVNLLVQKSYILGKDFFSDQLDMNITQTRERHGKHFQILHFATKEEPLSPRFDRIMDKSN